MRSANSWVWLAISFVAWLSVGPALAQEPSYKPIRRPPHWSGEKPEPGYACPYEGRKLLPSWTVKVACKMHLVGSVTNVTPFMPGPFEDKGDPDWMYLKDYWQTGKRFYFAREVCDWGETETQARGRARIEVSSRISEAAQIWDDELRSGKFRPALALLRHEQLIECKTISNGEQAGSDVPADPDQSESQQEAVAAPAEREGVPGQVTFEFDNETADDLNVGFYSQTYNSGWPGGEGAYILKKFSKAHKVLSCTDGEKICYGVWTPDTVRQWGAGFLGRGACAGCCRLCGAPPAEQTISTSSYSAPDNTLILLIKSLDSYTVDVNLFNASATLVWPGSNRVWSLDDSKTHRFVISCRDGEKICYGASRRGNSDVYWGVGPDGRRGCANCCTTCGTGALTMTLNAYEGSSGGSSEASSIIGDVVSGIVGGLVVGGAIGGAVGHSPRGGGGGSGGGAPRGQSPRQSDISR